MNGRASPGVRCVTGVRRAAKSWGSAVECGSEEYLLQSDASWEDGPGFFEDQVLRRGALGLRHDEEVVPTRWMGRTYALVDEPYEEKVLLDVVGEYERAQLWERVW